VASELRGVASRVQHRPRAAPAGLWEGFQPLRVARSLDDIASMTDDAAHRAAIARHADLLREAGAAFGPHDRAELDRRQAKLVATLTLPLRA
jgi:hypothetical protein